MKMIMKEYMNKDLFSIDSKGLEKFNETLKQRGYTLAGTRGYALQMYQDYLANLEEHTAHQLKYKILEKEDMNLLETFKEELKENLIQFLSCALLWNNRVEIGVPPEDFLDKTNEKINFLKHVFSVNKEYPIEGDKTISYQLDLDDLDFLVYDPVLPTEFTMVNDLFTVKLISTEVEKKEKQYVRLLKTKELLKNDQLKELSYFLKIPGKLKHLELKKQEKNKIAYHTSYFDCTFNHYDIVVEPTNFLHTLTIAAPQITRAFLKPLVDKLDEKGPHTYWSLYNILDGIEELNFWNDCDDKTKDTFLEVLCHTIDTRESIHYKKQYIHKQYTT